MTISITSTPDWTNRAELLDFANVLDRADHFISTTDVLDFFDAPHKWVVEYALWVRLGRPNNRDDDHWDTFVSELEEL